MIEKPKLSEMENYLNFLLKDSEWDDNAFMTIRDRLANMAPWPLQRETAVFCDKKLRELGENANEKELEELNQILRYGCMLMIDPMSPREGSAKEIDQQIRTALCGMLRIVREEREHTGSPYTLKEMENFLETMLSDRRMIESRTLAGQSKMMIEDFGDIRRATANYCIRKIERLRLGKDKKTWEELTWIKEFGCKPLLYAVAVTKENEELFVQQMEDALRGMLEIVREARKHAEKE